MDKNQTQPAQPRYVVRSSLTLDTLRIGSLGSDHHVIDTATGETVESFLSLTLALERAREMNDGPDKKR